MTAAVLLMAGGKSERMRALGNTTHKALRMVAGRTLLERNFTSALDAGFDDIVIAVSERESALEAYLRDFMTPLAASRGVRFETIRERTALGNIGAAGLLAERADDVLVLYVDNLCALDLVALVGWHRAGKYAATFATHEEVLTDPYGDLILDGDEVVAYREKPTRRVRISSGTCVIASRAARHIPLDRATGANDLFAFLRARGESVGAFKHQAPWVDVNDVPSLAKAERLVTENPHLFESPAVLQ